MNNETEQELASFVETQFFFYMLPCYYGLIAMIWRYTVLLEREPQYYVNRLPGEALFRLLEEKAGGEDRQSETLPFKVPSASYVIKTRLCLWNAYLYLFALVLSFFSAKTLFYAANHRGYSLLYLFGFAAWYFAAVLLRREWQRGLPQSLWIHRVFWISAGTFSFFKLFQDYALPLNLGVNFLFLAVPYALYRAEDTPAMQLSHSEDTPNFMKVFFQTIELNSRLRKILGIEDEPNENADDTAFEAEDLKKVIGVVKHTAQNLQEVNLLLKMLPWRNFLVHKKPRFVREKQQLKAYYMILTQIGVCHFEAERTVQHFLSLDLQLAQLFSPKNFPSNPYPRFHDAVAKVQSRAGQEFQQAQRAQVMEKWLQQISKVPIFMVQPLLQFLCIDAQRSAPFKAYFDFSFKMCCSTAFLLRQNRTEVDPARKSIAAYAEVKRQESNRQKWLRKIREMEFAINVQYQGTTNYCLLQLVCVLHRKRSTWVVRRTEIQILAINKQIQEQCSITVPVYYRLMIEKDHTSLKHKQELLRDYLQTILSERKYYCQALFDLIRFDPVEMEVKRVGVIAEVEARNSGMESDYSFKETIQIQVTKVSKKQIKQQQQDNFEFDFTIVRNNVSLQYTSKDLLKFRSRIAAIYKGINAVAQLQFKKCHKNEAKKKVQQFLLSLQSLPKIDINWYYKQFYNIQDAK